ncbi:MAG: hypothetical protein ABIO38_09545 [Luteimonas sp.]
MSLKTRTLLALAGLLLFAAVVLPQVVTLSDTLQGLLYGLACGALLTALLRWQLPAAYEVASPALHRRYLREFLPPMLAYVVVLFLSLWLLKRIDGPWILRGVVALLPALPLALGVRAIVRYIRDADEMQRRIELEAVSIATACIAMLYMSAGFLQLAKVIDISAGVAMIWMFPLICLGYGLAKVVVSRRYG